MHLSETQRRVLVALCRPFRDGSAFATPATNQEIAAEVFLGVDAVKTHLRALFAKFGSPTCRRTRSAPAWSSSRCGGATSARGIWRAERQGARPRSTRRRRP